MMSHGMRPLSLEAGGWLKPVLFDPSSRIARDTACQMLRSLCDSYERTKAVSLQKYRIIGCLCSTNQQISNRRVCELT